MFTFLAGYGILKKVVIDMKKFLTIPFWIYAALSAFIANSYLLLPGNKYLMISLAVTFVLINLFIGIFRPRIRDMQLRTCHHGTLLLCVFAASTVVSILYHAVLAGFLLPNHDYMTFLWSTVLCICAEAILFWNGIICVYLTSHQLGVKHRVTGLLCGMIPVLNLIMLRKIVETAIAEIDYEIKKEAIDSERADLQVCKTKYPILLVHGVFFRDFKHFNYWGRIPKALKVNGATIYYGDHQSAASIKDSAKELAQRIKEIIDKYGCEKVNIIAHSKGGLDCRYAMANFDIAPYVASLTTINTPHRGCLFADHLLTKIPPEFQDEIAQKYNKVMRKLGDPNPDFLAAVNDLTASHCSRLDEELGTPDGVYCQSVGSIVKTAFGGKFPLNFSYHFVKTFDGENDGLVSEASFPWGEDYQLLTPTEKRGISHGDMIDLNRENFDGFDVREFYVELVNKLKEKGL